MNIDREEVRKIAHIARIAVQENELDLLVNQLGEVLSYAQRVTELAADLQDQSDYVGAVNVVRQDAVAPSPVQTVMAVAPETEKGYYVVPKILENNK